MPKFKFSKRVKYDAVYEQGQVVDHLSQADTDNLRAGGYGDYVEEAPAPPPVATIPDTDRMVRPADRQVRSRKSKN